MSERYSKLFSLPTDLYAEGAPVIVSAGNLLKDNQTGKVLAQLKIKNIAAKPLKAATVLIHPQDAAGKPMQGDTLQKYLDLTAKIGEEFGQKTAVFLPDASTRGFSVEVTQAVFSDNSTWEGTVAPWEPLPAPESLSRKLGDAELLKQYQIRFGGKCETVPQVNMDLWRCACGAWNKDEKCYACEKGKETLFSLDLNELKAERDARLAKEKAEREAKAAADKAAADAKAKKTKKLLTILIPAVIGCIALLLIITKIVVPNYKYSKAKALFDAGQYEEAIDAFIMMNGYKDSVSYIQQANAEIEKAEQYSDAISAMNTGTIESVNRAKNMFEELDDYKDSAQLAEECSNLLKAEQYSDAISSMNAGTTESVKHAKKMFEELGDYKDSQQLAEECSNLLKDAAFQTYNNALALMDAQKYKTAWERFSKYPEYADSSEKMQECMAALFSEAEQLYKDKDYRPAFLLFEFCRSNAYSASKAKEKMDKCNDAYVSSLLGGKWIDEDAAFPLYSFEKHITVYSIQYRYVGNKIEFSVSYSIKKTGNYTGTIGGFAGESSPYFTDFGQCNPSLTGSSFTLSVDYDALMRGFRDGDFDRAILSMDYQLTSNYYDGFLFYFSQEDLEKTDLYGNLI